MLQLLQPLTFPPGAFVLRCGQPHAEMYFIERGLLHELAADGSVSRVLSDHDFFGERAMVHGESRARHSIVAQSYVLAMGLTSEDFSCAVTRSALTAILATHLGDEDEEGVAPATAPPAAGPGRLGNGLEC